MNILPCIPLFVVIWLICGAFAIHNAINKNLLRKSQPNFQSCYWILLAYGPIALVFVYVEEPRK